MRQLCNTKIKLYKLLSIFFLAYEMVYLSVLSVSHHIAWIYSWFSMNTTYLHSCINAVSIALILLNTNKDFNFAIYVVFNDNSVPVNSKYFV